jgi:hypothetical protein
MLDPPFGGRVEPLAHHINQINQKYKQLNKTERDLAVFWGVPLLHGAPNLEQFVPLCNAGLTKVDYENHPLFQDGVRARNLDLLFGFSRTWMRGKPNKSQKCLPP